jgi:GDP-4-dehydro-6-deoxy-D-mannose reductase
MPAETPPRRILVTGAGGFVGRHLMPALRQAFPQALLLATSREGPVPGADALLPFDLLDPGAFPAMLAAAAPEAVLHLAAQANVPAAFADPAGTWRANVDGTLALAEAMRRDHPAARLVYVSSAEVYGLSFRAGTALAEDAALAPANPYAASKAAAEIGLAEMALRGLRLLRLRPFTHVGPGQSPDYALAAFARQIALMEAGRQEPVMHTGALDRWRDMLDVRDVCAAYATALAAPTSVENGGVLNIASGVPRLLADAVAALLALAGVQAELRTDPARLRLTDVLRTQGDATQARAHLGWAPRVPWEVTLRDLLTDWRHRVKASI